MRICRRTFEKIMWPIAFYVYSIIQYVMYSDLPGATFEGTSRSFLIRNWGNCCSRGRGGRAMEPTQELLVAQERVAPQKAACEHGRCPRIDLGDLSERRDWWCDFSSSSRVPYANRYRVRSPARRCARRHAGLSWSTRHQLGHWSWRRRRRANQTSSHS